MFINFNMAFFVQHYTVNSFYHVPEHRSLYGMIQQMHSFYAIMLLFAATQ